MVLRAMVVKLVCYKGVSYAMTGSRRAPTGAAFGAAPNFVLAKSEPMKLVRLGRRASAANDALSIL